MKLCIAGSDPGVIECCRLALEGWGSNNWEVVTSPAGSVLSGADVYIFDFCPGSQLPNPDVVARTLFLVDADDLGTLRKLLGPARVSVLLKPAHPTALRPFLEHAARQSLEKAGAVTNATTEMRSEADSLLECLLHSNLKLQEYDRSRTNFLARALHDFRAPLTALSGYCGLLIDQRLGPLNSDQIELLSRMQRSVARLSRLANAMFDLSMGQQVKREPELQAADVEAVVNQAIHEITPHADGKQIRITVTLNSPSETLMFDAAKIEQVLINLLENACKFTPKAGLIEIAGYPVCWSSGSPRSAQATIGQRSGRSLPNGYRIDVRDSGSGIRPEHLESVFEEFTSYAGGTDRSGGGLGLAICRMIIQAHHGAIWAESGPEGTQFSLILPFVRLDKSRLGVEPSDPWNASKALSA